MRCASQWRTLFAVLLPYLLVKLPFDRRIVRREADDDDDAEEDDRVDDGKDDGKSNTVSEPVDPGITQVIRTLFVLLGCATSLIFVRMNFASTANTIQVLLQNYNVLFASLFPNRVVCDGCIYYARVLKY